MEGEMAELQEEDPKSTGGTSFLEFGDIIIFIAPQSLW